MNRLSISARNGARGKHPRPAAAASGSSATIAWLYFALAAMIVYALWETGSAPAGAWWALGLFGAFQFVLMCLAVPATAFGSSADSLLSFDRLSLVAALLLFEPVWAACAAGGAALAFTIAANPYHESWWRRLPHAFGNGGMYLLATLAAGYAWLGVGGQTPIAHFEFVDIDRIALLIVVLQGANEILYAIMSWRGMDTAARRHPIHWPTALFEFVIAWTGVAAAIAFLRLGYGAFALYIFLILIIAVLLKFSVFTAERERRRARELAAINHVNQAVHSAASLDELFEIIFSEMRTLIPFAAFIIGAYDPRTNELDVRLNYDRGLRHPRTWRKPDTGILAWTIANRQSVFVEDARSSAHPALAQQQVVGEPAVSIMAAPIRFQNGVVGVVSVQDYRPQAFRLKHLRLLEGFAQQVGVAIVNTRLFSELQEQQKELEHRVAKRTRELERTGASLRQAVEQKEALLERLERENRRDALTGLANRRYLDEILRQEHYRAQRFDHPLAVAIADIDHFKDINDRWGHDIGDKALQSVATILGGEVRATDFAARYGGEEFVIVFPETTAEAARVACEKLRVRIAESVNNSITTRFTLSMSFGVAASRGGKKSCAQLLADADQALYRAKREGRNRVCAAEPESA